LDIFGENATDAEAAEMVRMLDIEGTGKVFYEEFSKMVTG
jgi:Ca2+-binding EF-hand superfamily protein